MRLTSPLSTLPAPISKNRVTPWPAIYATDSRQRTVPVTCSTRRRRISSGSVIGDASTLATSGAAGGLMVTPANAFAIASAAGCISAQWNGADTGSSMARLAPFVFAISTARSTAALSPETTTCPPPLSLAAWHTWPWAASLRPPSPPHSRDRAARPSRRRRPGPPSASQAARAQQPRGIADGEAAGRCQRRIFAERMAGHEGGIPADENRPRSPAPATSRSRPPSAPAGRFR